MGALTDRTIQSAVAVDRDKWISGPGPRGAGKLTVRIRISGLKLFYFRYTCSDGKRKLLALGEYSQKSGRGRLSLAEAIEKAGELTRLYRSGIRDLHTYLVAEARNKEREIKESEELRLRREDEANRGSLRKLLDGYVEHLERANIIDWKDVRSIFRLHVLGPFPDLANRKAAEVKAKDLREVLARLVDCSKGRTAGKLRSYLRAAFSSAIKAEFDPTAPSSLIGFAIEANPCDALPSMSKFNNAGERTLSEEELQRYLVEVENFSETTRRALCLGKR